MCADHSILPQGQPVGRMTSLLHGGHVRLGVNFMSWSNFCVGVNFFALERFYYLEWYYSDMGSRDVWSHHFMVVTWILVWFFSPVLDESFILVWFCLSGSHFTPCCNQPNLGMIFLRFGYNLRLSEILFLLVSLDILVWLTASWYDFLHFARLFRLSVIWFDLV